MAITYLQAPIIKWVIMNNQGTAAGGAKMYTYRSLNKVQQKTVYRDPAGTIPWTNPILFDANGTEGPFYWAVDSSHLDETYYIEVYDSDDNLLWTQDDYYPPGDGGGGNAVTYVATDNLIANNVFIDHIDDTANPTNVTNLVIASANHKGFTPDLVNPISTSTGGTVGPDTRFVKNNTNATDQITFIDFPLSDGPLTDDVTPQQYLRYQCTNSPAAETYKAFQFPVCQKVKNLAGREVTFTVWAKCGSGTENITAYTRQYFGTGGSPTAEARTSFATYGLTTTWTKQITSFVMPSVVGVTLSSTDDDALYIQLEMPLGEPCDIWFTKPSLYVGSIDPGEDFDTYDNIYSITNNPRTGSIMTSLMTSPPRGWLAMDDKSIGTVGSSASGRANKDCFQLYKTIWDGVSDAFAPVSTGRGASAVADFVAGKTLTLPLSLGRALAGSGSGAGLTTRVLGEYLGSETHTLSIAEMPTHRHPGSTFDFTDFNASGGGSPVIAASAGINALPLTITNQGGGGAHTIMQPTSFMNVFIKL